MAMGIFQQLDWLTTRVKRLCCAVEQIQQSGAGSYKVYTALLTQSGTSDELGIGSGDLTVGVTYRIEQTNPDCDWTNVGAPNNNFGTYFLATGTTPNSWGTDGLLRYNTGAPVATVLENTIGNIWFSYTNNAVQVINSNNLFPVGKTYATVQLNTDVYAPDQTFYSVRQNDGSTINLFSYRAVVDDFGTPFTNTPIEIRVYN